MTIVPALNSPPHTAPSSSSLISGDLSAFLLLEVFLPLSLARGLSDFDEEDVEDTLD